MPFTYWQVVTFLFFFLFSANYNTFFYILDLEIPLLEAANKLWGQAMTDVIRRPGDFKFFSAFFPFF
jgi:hypothetical protein